MSAQYVRQYSLLALVTGTLLGGWLSVRAAGDNSQAGAQIVAEGTSKGAVACARCHGFDGAADGSGAFPALAGQTEYYLSHQLHQYASGQRRNPIMESIAKGLTPDQMDAVALYYAKTNPPSIPRRALSPELVERGRLLALTGDASARVQDCVSCHGPNGEGEPPTIPYLAGQYKHYIQVQLSMFNKGYRTSEQMARVAHQIPEQHIEAIAAYFDQLPRPANPSTEERTWKNQPTASSQSHSKAPEKK
jgi:cytochrome c553